MNKSTYVLVTLLSFVLSGVALAGNSRKGKEEMKFTGDIISVDTQTHTFTVRNQENGQTREMKFYVDAGAKIMVDGERKMLINLEKGEWVTVTYEPGQSQNIPMHVQRHKAWLPEAPHFEGMVVSVDLKEHTFTVKHEEKGDFKEMKFHVDAGTKVIINGERQLISAMAKGDEVNVSYTGSESNPVATHVKHKKATD
jgi:hypothetical protein